MAKGPATNSSAAPQSAPQSTQPKVGLKMVFGVGSGPPIVFSGTFDGKPDFANMSNFTPSGSGSGSDSSSTNSFVTHSTSFGTYSGTFDTKK